MRQGTPNVGRHHLPGSVRRTATGVWTVLTVSAAVLVGGCEALPLPEEVVRATPQGEAYATNSEMHETCPEDPTDSTGEGPNGTAGAGQIAPPPLPTPPPPGELPAAPRRTDIPEALVDVEVFGTTVYGLHPEMRDRLLEAERLLAQVESSGASDQGRWGVRTISGYRPGSRAHSRGLAIDINYFRNPYIMHEQGEDELNRQLGEVYHRIARLMLGRDSVIPEEITTWPPSQERRMRLFQQLEEESRAMIAYFRLMQDRPEIDRHLQAITDPAPPAFWNEILPGGEEITADALQRQMLQDYVTLAGRAGPPVAGFTYPDPQPLGEAERPFVGDAQYRAPEFGFMNLSQELVRALGEVGIMWGGTDMANGSGDIMHFYLPAAEVSNPDLAIEGPAAKMSPPEELGDATEREEQNEKRNTEGRQGQ